MKQNRATSRKTLRNSKSAKTRLAAPDWAQIHAEYEANKESLRSVARWYGIPEATVRHRAKVEGWERRPRADLQPKTPRPTDPAMEFVPPAIAEAASATPEELVERGRGIVARLLDELDAETAYIGEIEGIIVAETANDKTAARRYAMERAISLPSRATAIRNLASAAKTLGEAAVPQGKKQAAADKAAVAGRDGRFAAPAAPKLVVNNSA